MERYSSIVDEDVTVVSWHVWKEHEGRLSKCVEEGTTSELLSYIRSLLPEFLEHCYKKREQAASYNSARAVAERHDSQDTVLLQVDFAENYTCVSQDEIQSAHWKQQQITLFTVALWHAGSRIESHCVRQHRPLKDDPTGLHRPGSSEPPCTRDSSSHLV